MSNHAFRRHAARAEGLAGARGRLLRGSVAALLCWAGIAAAAEAESPLLRSARLLLRDGHVVTIDDRGRIAAHAAPRLDLGQGAASIFAVAVDHAYDRLYVTPESDHARRGTRIFRLSTLEPVGLLPGVTRVVIPKRRDATVIAAVRYDPQEAGLRYAGLQELHENAAATVSLRARARPSDTLATGSDWRLAWARLECRSSQPDGFFGASLGQLVDDRLSVVADPRASDPALAGAAVLGCWPDGSSWLVVEREPRGQVPLAGRFAVLDPQLAVRGDLVANAPMPIERMRGVELGNDAGAWLVLDRQPDRGADSAGFAIDRQAATQVPLRHPALPALHADGFALQPAGLEPDRRTAYLVPTRYLAGGLRYRSSDRVFQASLDAASKLSELRLPEALLRINRANAVRLDPSLDDAAKEAVLERLPPKPPTLEHVVEVQIVHVLPAASGRAVPAREAPRRDVDRAR